MSILNWKVQFPDQVADVGGQQTRINTMACNDSLAVVLASGYLNQLVAPVSGGQSGSIGQGYVPLPQDFWFIYYNGGSGLFSIAISVAGVVTLSLVNSGYASVAITAAQFNGMHAAPIALLPAPGVGQLIVVNSLALVMTYNSAAYAAGGIVAAQWGSAVHGASPLATNSEAAADFFATASTTFLFTGVSGSTVGAVPLATSVNEGLYLSNATQAFTSGNSSFTANIQFSVVPA